MINYPEDILGPSFDGGVLFGGAVWPKPSTSAGLLTPLSRVRDKLLSSTRFRLENQSGAGHLISVDESDLSRPIEILWDLCLGPFLSWTDKWGSVSRAMEIHEREPGSKNYRYCAMAQIGAVSISEKVFEKTLKSSFIKDFKFKNDARHHLMTIENYFLSIYAAEKWAPGIVKNASSDDQAWIQVPDLEEWKTVVWNMATSHLS